LAARRFHLDVLGALTKDQAFAGTQIGKINVDELSTCVAAEAGIASEALRRLGSGKMKGRSVKVRLLERSRVAAGDLLRFLASQNRGPAR
jgi:DbpA RNA binding domain